MSLRAEGVAIPMEIAEPVASETRNLAYAPHNDKARRQCVTNHMNDYRVLTGSKKSEHTIRQGWSQRKPWWNVSSL